MTQARGRAETSEPLSSKSPVEARCHELPLVIELFWQVEGCRELHGSNGAIAMRAHLRGVRRRLARLTYTLRPAGQAAVRIETEANQGDELFDVDPLWRAPMGLDLPSDGRI